MSYKLCKRCWTIKIKRQKTQVTLVADVKGLTQTKLKIFFFYNQGIALKETKGEQHIQDRACYDTWIMDS